MNIRLMKKEESVQLQQMAQLVGWNQSVADCALLTESPWSTMICMEEDNKIVGTAGCCIYENAMGFINMVTVHPDYRLRGIASAMIRYLLENIPVKCFRLHATPAGSCVYSKLGFNTTRSMSYMVGKNPDFGASSADVKPATAADLDAMVKLDREMFGLERRGIFEDNLKRFGKFALKLERDGEFSGFCLGRRGIKQRQIAAVETAAGLDGVELIAAAAPLEHELDTNMILFDDDKEGIARAERAGMSKTRELIEMEYGEPGKKPGAGYHATYGGDFG